MSETFIHIGKFTVKPEHRGAFVALMRDYEKTAPQKGLTQSNVVEDETGEGTFMHVTLWETRGDWVAVEETPEHKAMHEKRNAMLAEPMQHDFVCGKVTL